VRYPLGVDGVLLDKQNLFIFNIFNINKALLFTSFNIFR